MRLSSEIKVGATIVIGLVLLAFMAVAVGRVQISPREGYSLEVMYNTVDGLREGAPVRYAGVNVGRVSFVRLEPAGVRVGIRLTTDMPIPVDSRFVIATVGVLGDKHVEIHPGRAHVALEPGVELRGVDPVMMDSILVEMDTTLRNLNQVVQGFAQIADSEELQAGIVESTILMRDTIGGLKAAVDQVNLMGLTLTEITGQVEVFTEQLTRTQLEGIAANLETFTSELAGLRLQESLEDFQTFTKELNTLPIQEMSREFASLTSSLNRLDMEGMEREVRQFTGMMAQLDLVPLLEEVTEVTRQISRMDIEQRGDELAAFTGMLAQLPLDEFAADLREITQTVKSIPLDEMGQSVLHFTKELERVPVAAISADLEELVAELRSLGLHEMAADVQVFTQELGRLDMDDLIHELTGEFRDFSRRLNTLEIEPLFVELQEMIDYLGSLGRSVTAEDVEAVMADMRTSSANVRQASDQLEYFIADIRQDTHSLAKETENVMLQVQASLQGIDAIVSDVQGFLNDVTAQGRTAQSLTAVLDNLEASTGTIRWALETIEDGLPLDSEMFVEIRQTMDSIQKINQDIQVIRGVGEFVNITPRLALSYAPVRDENVSFLTGDARFEFHPEGSPSFYVIGLTEIGGANEFQLQYGVDGTTFRQRYGIIDSRLGVALDGKLTDDFVATGELRFKDTLKLRVRADYQWLPDWWLMAEIDDVFMGNPDDLQLRIGIERFF